MLLGKKCMTNEQARDRWGLMLDENEQKKEIDTI